MISVDRRKRVYPHIYRSYLKWVFFHVCFEKYLSTWKCKTFLACCWCRSNRWWYNSDHLEMLANQRPTNSNTAHSLTSEKGDKVVNTFDVARLARKKFSVFYLFMLLATAKSPYKCNYWTWSGSMNKGQSTWTEMDRDRPPATANTIMCLAQKLQSQQRLAQFLSGWCFSVGNSPKPPISIGPR